MWFLTKFLTPHFEGPHNVAGPLTGDASPLIPNERIAFLGDSITEFGAGRGGYVWLIEKALSRRKTDLRPTLIKAGIRGNKVTDLQARLQKDVLAQKPTVVFIYIGINDVWHSLQGTGTPKERYKAGLRDLIQRIQAAGATVVLATPSVIGEKKHGTNELDAMLDEYAAISRTVAREMKAELCDLRRSFIEYLREHNSGNVSHGILTQDGVHLNRAGNCLVAELASASIASALRKRNARRRQTLELPSNPQPTQTVKLPLE